MSEAEPSRSRGGGTTGWAAFRHPDFVYVFIVRILNGMATVMLQLAVGWEMWRITRDELTLGLIGLAFFLPNFVFFLAAGTVADRFKRQHVMAASYALQVIGALLFLYIFSAAEPVVELAYAVIFLVGTGRTFAQPAQQSLLPNVVPVEHFPNAVAWASSGHQLSVVVGPVIGGALLVLGADVVFAVVAGGYCVSVVLILMAKARGQERARGPVTLETLFAGIRYIYNRQIILGAITLDLFAVVFGTANALMPVFATDVLGVGEVGLGFLRGAHAVGAVTVGLGLTHIPVTRHAGRILLLTVGLYGAAMCLFGLSTVMWLSLLALALAGASDMVSVFIRATLVQLATPDEMRGRVAAVHGMFTNASGQLGDFRAGVVAAVLSATASVVIGSLATVALALVWAAWFPRLRRVDALDADALRDDSSSSLGLGGAGVSPAPAPSGGSHGESSRRDAPHKAGHDE